MGITQAQYWQRGHAVAGIWPGDNRHLPSLCRRSPPCQCQPSPTILL